MRTDSWVTSKETNGLTLGWVNSKFFGVIDSRLSSGLKFTIFFKITDVVSSRFSKNIKVNVKWRFLTFLPLGINLKVVSTASSFILVLAGINFGRKLAGSDTEKNTGSSFRDKNQIPSSSRIRPVEYLIVEFVCLWCRPLSKGWTV